MADLIIKPATGDGNKLILQDKAGGAVLTTADSGATIADGIALGTPASGVVTNLSGVLPVGVTGGTGLDKDGWILLQTETASGGSSVTIDSTINSTYDDYMIVGSLVSFAGDSQLVFQAVLGGTLRTNSYKTQSHFLTSSATEINTTSASYAHAFIAGGANVQGGSAYGGINFNMYLSRPHDTTSRHTIWGSCAYRNSGGLSQGGSFSAIRETDAGALTEIKFFSSAYAFSGSGTIKLYGLSK